jgi:site-specific DNA recombinase
MLNKRVSIVETVHKAMSHHGVHAPIIDRTDRNKVRTIPTESARMRAARTHAATPALLKGLLNGLDGAAFSPTQTRKGGRLYRYSVSQTLLKHGSGYCEVGRLPAGEIEEAIIEQVRMVFRQPEIIARPWRAASALAANIGETDAREAHTRLDPLWDEIFPAEQARIVGLLVERVDIGTADLDVRLRLDGLTGLGSEMRAKVGEVARHEVIWSHTPSHSLSCSAW